MYGVGVAESADGGEFLAVFVEHVAGGVFNLTPSFRAWRLVIGDHVLRRDDVKMNSCYIFYIFYTTIQNKIKIKN
jgi:hypothetical protein